MKNPTDQYTVELIPMPTRGELAQGFSDFVKAMVTNVQVKVAGKTIFDGPPVFAKRGRGRPRVANPLSAAERARRYRLRQRHKNLELF